MKRISAILLILAFAALLFGCGQKTWIETPIRTDAPDLTAPALSAAPSGSPSPAEAPKTVMSPEFAVMDLGQKEYGADYSSLYDAFGESVTIADVKENGQGLAYITRDGKDYELGLDFLSMAMIYNTEPSGGFATAEDVCAEWWRYYALRWNRLLPEIPLYRNEYYTAYNTEITGVAENPVNPYFPQECAVLYWGSEKEDNSIIIGSTSEIAGFFRCPENARNSADLSIDALVNGLELVSKTREGGLCWNDAVVRSHEEIPVEGGVEYRIELWDDLYFSDGSPVTAVDYLAKLMAEMTPVFREGVGYYNGKPDFVSNHDPFIEYDGTEGTGVLSCVRLNGERSFTITLPSVYADSIYAIEQFGISAQPHELWLCGAQIRDDGEGCYITSDFYEMKDGSYVKAKKLENMLSFTAMTDPGANWPWSGPYRVVDPGLLEGSRTILERNEYYKGNYEGVRPSIERIEFVRILFATCLEELRNGGLDVITGITGSAEIEETLKLAQDSDGAFDTVHYSRAGYGAIMMRDDFGPVQFASVRRALAYCIDREGFAEEWLGGNMGEPVDAPLHEDLWLYRKAQERGLELEHYEKNKDRAIAELVADGWVYDENGEPYVSGVRYKRIPGDVIRELDSTFESVDGQHKTVKVGEDYYMPLVLNWYLSVDGGGFNPDLYLIEGNETLTEAGFYNNRTIGDFTSMLCEFYQQNIYGQFYVGTPHYNVFLFARGYINHDYSRAWSHAVDPDLFDDYSENYLRDPADVYFMNND
ncbi:MAG: hypothetical protein IKP26_02375 [Clostridia bacterium]|nr:hypothetical protein [Clostridia bacterium]MBR6108429.1 hypothetical protein [Clostridia bacterium]